MQSRTCDGMATMAMTGMPVVAETSSTAAKFFGFAMATEMRPLTMESGRSWLRRHRSSGTMLMTSLSIWYSLRSTNGRLMPCANALIISFEDAERIKNQIGLQNVTGDERLEKAEEVIRETTAQLIVGIRNTLNLYDVGHAGGTISGVVLTGTGARLIGLPPVLASSINKVVRIGDPFIRFRLSKEVERQNIMAHAIDLGAVLGLVIGKKPR